MSASFNPFLAIGNRVGQAGSGLVAGAFEARRRVAMHGAMAAIDHHYNTQMANHVHGLQTTQADQGHRHRLAEIEATGAETRRTAEATSRAGVAAKIADREHAEYAPVRVGRAKRQAKDEARAAKAARKAASAPESSSMPPPTGPAVQGIPAPGTPSRPKVTRSVNLDDARAHLAPRRAAVPELAHEPAEAVLRSVPMSDARRAINAARNPAEERTPPPRGRRYDGIAPPPPSGPRFEGIDPPAPSGPPNRNVSPPPPTGERVKGVMPPPPTGPAYTGKKAPNSAKSRRPWNYTR